MIWFWIIAMTAVIGIGLAVRWYVPQIPAPYSTSYSYGSIRSQTVSGPGPYSVSRVEFIITLLVIGLVVIPVTGMVGEKLAVAQQIDGFHEFWNGSIIETGFTPNTCTENGDCDHTFECHGHWVTVTTTSIDSEGRPTTESHLEYESDQCPYATVEYDYWIRTNIHDEPIVIDDDVFDANPVVWDPGEGQGIPGDVQRGPGALWVSYRDAIAAGDAPPATRVNDYSNFVLATRNDLLKEFSDSISEYRKANLLPSHTVAVPESDDPTIGVTATKVQFVGGVPGAREWNDALARFNAQLGATKQGDMHLVVVRADKIDDPDDYISALTAYWQSNKFGKWGIAKNVIAVAVGVSDDGKKVEWARARTGMPLGNEEMLEAIALRLDGKPFTVDSLFGTTRVSIVNGEPKYETEAKALIPKTVLDDFPFKRASMSGKDKGDNGDGFVYLGDEVEANLSTGAYALMFLIVVFVAAIAWAICAAVDFSRTSTPNERPRHGSYR